MPFFCMSESKTIYAEDLSPSEWQDLKLYSKSDNYDYAMPCCGSKAIPAAGTNIRRPHFKHPQGCSCHNEAWGDYDGIKRIRRRKKQLEDRRHEKIKDIIFDVAQKAGWCAEKEAPGCSRENISWRADVLVKKGEKLLAFEVQTSPQAYAEYRRRQEIYKDSGVKCIWISWVTPEFSDEDTPVFELSYVGSIYVVDFPDFFEAASIKAPQENRGLPLGDFIYSILNLEIPWACNWSLSEDRLALIARKNRPYRVELDKNVDDANVDEIVVGDLKRNSLGIPRPPTNKQNDIAKPNVNIDCHGAINEFMVVGCRLNGFRIKSSCCASDTVVLTNMQFDRKMNFVGAWTDLLSIDIAENISIIWQIVPSEIYTRFFDKTKPNVCEKCGDFQKWSRNHKYYVGSMPFCIQFTMPVSSSFIGMKRSGSLYTYASPFPLEQFKPSHAKFEKWWPH